MKLLCLSRYYVINFRKPESEARKEGAFAFFSQKTAAQKAALLSVLLLRAPGFYCAALNFCCTVAIWLCSALAAGYQPREAMWW